MRHADELTDAADDYCLALPGEAYAIYLPRGGTTGLRLPQGTFVLKWYNPRRGGDLEDGSVKTVSGPGTASLGTPPRETAKDWVVLVRKTP